MSFVIILRAKLKINVKKTRKELVKSFQKAQERKQKRKPLVKMNGH